MTALPRRQQTNNDEPKSVRFNSIIEIQEIPNIESFSSKEIKATWYQESEFQQMDANNDADLDIMITEYDENKRKRRKKRSLSSQNSNYCPRGLEILIPERSIAREKRISGVWDAVITEQLRQWTDDIEDPDTIAMIYHRLTTLYCCETVAHKRGLKDEKQAKIIAMEDNEKQKMNRRGSEGHRRRERNAYRPASNSSLSESYRKRGSSPTSVRRRGFSSYDSLESSSSSSTRPVHHSRKSRGYNKPVQLVRKTPARKSAYSRKFAERHGQDMKFYGHGCSTRAYVD